VTALAAYFDESKSEGVVTIAGYLGTVSDWNDRFIPAWQDRVLDQSPRPIREYKAANCRHGRGEFTDWTQQERTALTTSCVDIIVDNATLLNIVGIGAVVAVRDMNDVDAVPASSSRRSPDIQGFAYCMCFWFVMEAALRLAEPHLGTDRLLLVFDDEKRLRHRAESVFESGLDEYPHFRGRVHAPSFLDSQKILPLQAADLLAYETYKEMRNRAADPPRSVSRALSRLVEGRKHIAHYCDGTLLRMIRRQSQGSNPPLTFDLPVIYQPGEVCRPLC
jgi:hypothetical protein